MEFNIDEYKVNGHKLYINGWVHQNNYKIKIVSEKEEQEIKEYTSRYDICMQFHEKIEDNNYGFKEELTFSKKIKVANIYLVQGKNEELIYNIDNRKLMNNLRKIKKLLGKIKRGIHFLWREYHFLVPPVMMKKYLLMLIKRDKKKQIYNPEIASEYNTWLEKVPCQHDGITSLENLTIVENKQELATATTKYVCLKAPSVELAVNFYKGVKQAIEQKYDLIYFDNDRLSAQGYEKPMFKPDWSRDTLLGINYIGNCYIIKKSLLENNEFNLYKILLSCINKNLKIKHIPQILYHDKKDIKNGIEEVKEYLKENKINAEVIKNNDKTTNTVIYKPKKDSLISIIIPTKDHADILEQCLKSIYEKTTYKNFEIIVIDNNSCEQETFELLKKYSKKYKNFTYKRIECEFNYSYLNNEAVKMTRGDYILLLNNDIEVITPEWLEIMLGYAEQKHIGTVGVKLLFPDETIQHAGIIMGKGGLAGHAHYGKPRNYESLQYELKIPYDYSACTAACLMISKKKYKEVNGLEEKLKVAFNDVDFNLKLLVKGYNNVFLPNVELFHYESKSRGLDTSAEKQKRFIQEWSLIKEKWSKYIEHDNFYNDNFSKNDDYMLK